MADLKKEEPKRDLFADGAFYFLCALVVVALLNRAIHYFNSWRAGSSHSYFGDMTLFFINNVWPIFKIFGLVVVVLSTLGIANFLGKLRKIIEEENEIYGSHADGIKDGEVPQMQNAKWDRVISHINSPNQSDWKLAIMEADIMLDDLLKASGYHGDSIGEKLKGVEKSDFLTLDAAWEAHKIRNRIAHDGADFDLNERIAKQTVAQFESVFREFKII